MIFLTYFDLENNITDIDNIVIAQTKERIFYGQLDKH
jgi:hypothetical protein